MKRVLVIFTAIFIFPLALFLPACAKSDGGFGIYLIDSGEMVLSLEHIKAYHSLDCSLELNAEGIEKWNSFQTSTTVPKLSQSLYQRDFILKINNQEVCRGKFYSLVSSASYDGVVILDSIVKLDDEHSSIKIDFGYAVSIPASEENHVTSELESFFSSKHMLVADEGWDLP
jgi:hypothetical protein